VGGNGLSTFRVETDFSPRCLSEPRTHSGVFASSLRVSGRRREPRLADFLKHLPKLWLRREAHGSIRVQEGEPIYLSKLSQVIEI